MECQGKYIGTEQMPKMVTSMPELVYKVEKVDPKRLARGDSLVMHAMPENMILIRQWLPTMVALAHMWMTLVIFYFKPKEVSSM